MLFSALYKTPDNFSDIIIESDGEFLTGLRFCDPSGGLKPGRQIQGSEPAALSAAKTVPVVKDTIRWLDIYFSGKDPGFTPKFRIDHLTPFRSSVIAELVKIPYGKTVTYGKIAERIAQERGISRMSAQAVGGAVGWNPICLIIPCHRVIGSNGSLTGYGGGIINKGLLLGLEKSDYIL